MSCTSGLLTTSASHFVQVRVGMVPGGTWSIAITAHGRDGAQIPAKQPFSRVRDGVEVVFA
jgi:hypothetical protein